MTPATERLTPEQDTKIRAILTTANGREWYTVPRHDLITAIRQLLNENQNLHAELAALDTDGAPA